MTSLSLLLILACPLGMVAMMVIPALVRRIWWHRPTTAPTGPASTDSPPRIAARQPEGV